MTPFYQLTATRLRGQPSPWLTMLARWFWW